MKEYIGSVGRNLFIVMEGFEQTLGVPLVLTKGKGDVYLYGRSYAIKWEPRVIEEPYEIRELTKQEKEKLESYQDIPVKRGDLLRFISGEEGLGLGLVIQNDKGNMHAPTTIVCSVYLSREAPSHAIPLNSMYSFVWAPRTIDKKRIMKNIGNMKVDMVNQVITNTLFDKGAREVYWVDLPKGVGSEQGGEMPRPCLILHREKDIVAIPITNAMNQKRKIPTHVFISSYDFKNRQESIAKHSILLWEQPIKISKEHMHSKIGELNEYAVKRLEGAARVSFGL